MPALAGAEPGDVRRACRAARLGRRGGRPDHHRVVGVGHHPHVRVPDQRGPPQLRHHGDLLGPVELVAGEVEQRDHVRLGGLQHLRRGSARRPPAPRTGCCRPWPARRCARSACWRRRSWWRPGPSTPTAAAVSRVVVVLPLVPETRAMARPAARWASRSGSILRPIHPPITEPSPRPAARDSAAAVRDTELATLARRGIFASVTRARLPDRRTRASHRRRDGEAG